MADTGKRYFAFRALPYDIAHDVIGAAYDDDFKREVYGEWLSQLYRRLRVFYISQETAYQDGVYRKMCRDLGLDWSIPIGERNEDYTEEFRGYLSETDFYPLVDADSAGLGAVGSQMDMYLEPKPSAYFTAESIGKRFGEMLERGKMFPYDVADVLWGHWFGMVTRVSGEQQHELRRLPYREYLETSYWRRVRAAMMVAHQLRCQGSECCGLDNWLYGEFDLNVHHLHYRNKGRESFGNLRLLCRQCHERVHNGDTSHLPGATLMYRDFADSFEVAS